MLAAINLPGLELVQATQALRAGGSRFRHIQILASDHPFHPCGRGQLGRRGQQVRWLSRLCGQEQLEGLGVEAVAGQDRHVLAKRPVARGPAPAQIVVVHGRKVVVDQRVCVNQLDRGGQGQHHRGVLADRLGGGQREYRADPLPAGQQRVPHGLHQP